MSTSYADRRQGDELDRRLLGGADEVVPDNWFDDGPDIFSQQCNASDAKRLASLPGRLQIAMGQLEAFFGKQGGL